MPESQSQPAMSAAQPNGSGRIVTISLVGVCAAVALAVLGVVFWVQGVVACTGAEARDARDRISTEVSRNRERDHELDKRLTLQEERTAALKRDTEEILKLLRNGRVNP